ncbi:MAG: c-type cytochrome, partial [Bacteroidota bacterium]|nr:c-type cytochrome [Bacteroidota bacterium]
MKKISLTIAALALAHSTMSQSSEAVPNGILHDPLFPIYLTAGGVLLLLIAVALVGIYVIRVLNFLTREAALQNALQSKIKSEKDGSWLKRFIEKMNAAVPVEQESEIVLEHSYDGIRELDNHLPPWWKWLFNGSIAFAILYMIVYHVTDSLPLSHDEFRQELALAEEQAKKYQASQPQAVIDENTLTYTADPALIESGKSIFMSNNCGGCHRNDGGGNTIGPNLADEYWLHGGEVTSVFKTIKNGVVEKG